eukprot:COSAG02_NODE_3004_length_7571_cov_65.586188_9_plen_103_part_00
MSVVPTAAAVPVPDPPPAAAAAVAAAAAAAAAAAVVAPEDGAAAPAQLYGYSAEQLAAWWPNGPNRDLLQTTALLVLRGSMELEVAPAARALVTVWQVATRQ